MEIEHKNQNNNNIEDLKDLFEIDYVYENDPIKRTINITNLVDKQSLLEKLKMKIISMSNCELKKNSNRIVFNDGDIQSQIMIIGEGPGQKEDEIGKPFVGDAGVLLNKMLEAINIDRQKVYVTNVVNYRPPANRAPSETEIKRYLPYLKKHIEIISPKIVVLLGKTALNTLIGNEVVISKARGKWIQKEIGTLKTWIIASFHPAFLMRQPEQKKLAWIDLKMIRDKSKALKI